MSEISLILVLQNKNKQNSEWQGKNTNKIRETHSFWGDFSIMEQFGLRATSRIKTFVFKFISVPAKWIKTSRRHVLNIYSDNNTYANLFKTDFG